MNARLLMQRKSRLNVVRRPDFLTQPRPATPHVFFPQTKQHSQQQLISPLSASGWGSDGGFCRALPKWFSMYETVSDALLRLALADAKAGLPVLALVRVEVLPFLCSFADLLWHAFDRRLTVVLHVDSECPPWWVDPDALEEALLRLAASARRCAAHRPHGVSGGSAGQRGKRALPLAQGDDEGRRNSLSLRVARGRCATPRDKRQGPGPKRGTIEASRFCRPIRGLAAC